MVHTLTFLRTRASMASAPDKPNHRKCPRSCSSLPHSPPKPTSVQVPEASFKVDGLPRHFVRAACSRSPNEDVNALEATRVQLEADATAAASPTARPVEFFFSVSPPRGAPAGAPHAVYLANNCGGARRLFELPADVGVANVCYHASAHAVVCVMDDQTMTTHSEQGGDWQVLTRMRFSTQRAASASSRGTFLCAWTGAPRAVHTTQPTTDLPGCKLSASLPPNVHSCSGHPAVCMSVAVC